VAARKAVEHEARAVVARLPLLLTLKFLDGSPFASPEASAWLAPSEPEPAAAAQPAVPQELEAALLKRVPDAFKEAELCLVSSSPRQAFELRLVLAQGLRAAGKGEASLALLCSLEQDLDRYRLEEWEPALALRYLRMLFQQLSTEEGVK